MPIPEQIKQVYQKSTRLYTTAQVEEALDRIAIQISQTIGDKNPVILCVMVGGMVPMANLLLRLDFPLEVDYVHASRYQGEITAGKLHWKVRPKLTLKDRTVLVVDDILDGGLTLAAILTEIEIMGASEIYSAVLVDKRHARLKGGLKDADFKALEVDDHYIFGYGMDYHEYLRNAPGIYVVASEDE